MKKKIILVLLVIFTITLTGCEKPSFINNNEPTTTTKILDHKVYKYVKLSLLSVLYGVEIIK